MPDGADEELLLTSGDLVAARQARRGRQSHAEPSSTRIIPVNGTTPKRATSHTDAEFAGRVGQTGDFVQSVHEALNRIARALPILPCTARSMARKPVNRLAVVKRFGRIYTPRRTGFSSCIIRYLWESCEQIPAARRRGIGLKFLARMLSCRDHITVGNDSTIVSEEDRGQPRAETDHAVAFAAGEVSPLPRGRRSAGR